MFDDLFDFEPSYAEIMQNVKFIEKEVANLDQDSLVDEVRGIQYHIVGKELEKLQFIINKHEKDADLDIEEMMFLRNVYIIYYCQYALVVDEQEDDDGEV